MMNLKIEVIRHRRSVTQGTAEVLCNGQSVVTYGDDYVLDGKSVYHENEVYPMYGEIITGWGSRRSDEHFITGAIRQYSDKINKIIGEV